MEQDRAASIRDQMAASLAQLEVQHRRAQSCDHLIGAAAAHRLHTVEERLAGMPAATPERDAMLGERARLTRMVAAAA